MCSCGTWRSLPSRIGIVLLNDVVHVLKADPPIPAVAASRLSSMCCEQQWMLPEIAADGLPCQTLLLTARGVAALVGVRPVSWLVDHEMINVIQS